MLKSCQVAIRIWDRPHVELEWVSNSEYSHITAEYCAIANKLDATISLKTGSDENIVEHEENLIYYTHYVRL